MQSLKPPVVGHHHNVITWSILMTQSANFSLPSMFYAQPTYLSPDMTIAEKPVAQHLGFKCANPDASMKYSEPVRILAVHYNKDTREIRAVGDDTNVRVCKIDRLDSIDVARELYATVKAIRDAGTIISFQTAGGFSPDRWFMDVVKG
jgi:hypothetical protein